MALEFSFSFLTLSLRLAAALLTYWLAKCIYRITFHPLAKFPGPPLAGMTRLYAMSWDIPIATSYSDNFAKWHDRYGSVIRIEPNHLHIRDLDAYNQVFKIGTKFNRDPAIYGLPFTRGSFFNKLIVREGKAHRDLYVPYFSKANVNKMEYMIREHMSNFLKVLDQACTAGKEVDLSLGYRCLTADTLMSYLYDKPFGAIEYPDFKFPMIHGITNTIVISVNIESFFDNSTQNWYFPKVFGLLLDAMLAVPRSWIQFHKPIASALANLDGCRDRIVDLQRESEANMTPSVFQTALHPNPEKGHPVLSRDALAADALTMFTAGTDTTAHALVTGTWKMMKQPEILRKLQAVLREAIPDPDQMNLSWAELEKIDYLRGVVKESIRLSYGVPGKIPRETPPGGATLVGSHVPGGTMLSMSCRVYHHYEPYFPNADEFLPDRWVDEKSAVDAEKHMIAFSRGSRNCIGVNLAYAELFYGFAYVFRKFEMLQADDMTDRDMEWHDAFVCATFGHLRVKLRKVQWCTSSRE